MEKIKYTPIGIIHSPYKSVEDVPYQSTEAKGIQGTVVIEPRYQEGLRDLEGFSHVHLIFCLHLSSGYSLMVKPFLDNTLHGVFATRAPRRPNAIGLSIVRLLSIEGNTLHIEDPDMVDGTPLLDIKPYIPGFDRHNEVKIGWLTGKIDVTD
jgi:tRNA-Thr(GGU) m(6)t(6)A37 methyltransferase TsaA